MNKELLILYQKNKNTNIGIDIERVKNINSKKFQDSDKNNYYLIIFMDKSYFNKYKPLHNILFVNYILDDSFYHSNRISKNLSEKFDIKIWAHSDFTINYTIFYLDGITET